VGIPEGGEPDVAVDIRADAVPFRIGMKANTQWIRSPLCECSVEMGRPTNLIDAAVAARGFARLIATDSHRTQ
jgi:hypothetical protein